jgi:DNA repair photolyase
MQIFELECKSLLTKSKIPSLDYAVNPYFGCQHACVYCYATFMTKFRNAPGEWGSFVGIKANAPEVLRRELRRRAPGDVCFGTVCDAYQPVEERYAISRACLEAFVGVPGFDVGILTKSDLVLRDVDVLKRLERSDVGFTVTCLDAGLARLVEPGAPPPSRRLAAMRELASKGIPVWGFFGPILPTFTDSDEAITEVLREMARSGAGRVLVDRLNLYPRVWASMKRLLSREFPDRLAAVQAIKADPGAYEAHLAQRIDELGRSVGIAAETCF